MKFSLIIRLIFIFVIHNIEIYSQNLVPNSSFDEVDSCNTEPNWLWNLSSWTNLGFYDGIAHGTPDVYNACNYPSPPSAFNFPYTALTFQYPHSGTGFVGMLGGYCFNRPQLFLTNLDRGREYFAAELNDTLQAGKMYCVGGFMNCINNPFLSDTNSFWEIYTDRISIGFHRYIPHLTNTWLFSDVEHICNLTKEDSTKITDTLNWASIRTPYQASGNESVILMGNFYSDTSSGYYFHTNFNLDSIYALPKNEFLAGFYATPAYFYFDDIYVVPIEKPNIVAQTAENGYVWLIDTSEQEERRWYKTGDDLVLGTGDSLHVLASTGQQYSLLTRNCRVEMNDTIVVDVSFIPKTNTDITVNLFPNPTKNNIIIQSTFIQQGRYFLLKDVTGRTIDQKVIQSDNQLMYDASSLPNGTYFIYIKSEDGAYLSQRIVVMH
jgi:hypothetical protein